MRQGKRASLAAGPTVGRCRVESVGRSSLAGSEQEQIAPAPTNGVVSYKMRYPNHRASPSDTNRVEHRSSGVRGRTSTRRSSFHGARGIGDGCTGVHSTSAMFTRIRGNRGGRGRAPLCGRDACGIEFSVFDDACQTCSCCGRMHDPASRLCFDCQRPGPGEGNIWHHLVSANFRKARRFLESCAGHDGERPVALVQNYQTKITLFMQHGRWFVARLQATQR